MKQKRVRRFYSDLTPTVLAALLMGTFLSLSWDSVENWLFASFMYILAISIQQNLFGEKHFDPGTFGQSAASSQEKKGLFLFGHWTDPESEDLSENRKLMELSKISYKSLMLIAQIALVGGYLFAVLRLHALPFHFGTLIHLAAAIYLMLTTHKGHLFLALIVNLIPVILALRNGSEAPAWALWATIPYGVCLIHALVNLHDFDLKRLFERNGNPWALETNRTFAKTRRVIFDFLPIVFVFLVTWKLFLKTGNEVSSQVGARFSPEKILENKSKLSQKNPSMQDSSSGEPLIPQSGSNDGNSEAQFSNFPAPGSVDLKSLEKEMQALQDPETLKKLGMNDQKGLQDLLQKLSGARGPTPRSPSDPQIPSGGGNALTNEDEIKTQLQNMKKMVEDSEKDGDPFLSMTQSKASPAASPGEEDDLSQLNEELKQTLKVREVLKNFGNEPPLETLKKLQALQQASPKKSLALDPDNPELNDYVKKYSQNADELAKRFRQPTDSREPESSTPGPRTASAGAQPLTSPEQMKSEIEKFQKEATDPTLKEKLGKMVEKIDRPSQPLTPPDSKPLKNFFESLSKLLPWFLALGAFFIIGQYFNRMKKPSPEELEEETKLEIETSQLQQLTRDLKEILSEKNLSNNEKIIQSFNIALELMRSLNFPKPDGMPAEDFPRSFPKPINHSMGADFETITEMFSVCFYGKYLVNDGAIQNFDQSMKQIFKEAHRFQVKDGAVSAET